MKAIYALCIAISCHTYCCTLDSTPEPRSGVAGVGATKQALTGTVVYTTTNTTVSGQFASWIPSQHPLNVLREMVMPYGQFGSWYDCYYRTTSIPNQPADVGFCTRSSGPTTNPQSFAIDCRAGNGAGTGQCRLDWVNPNGPPNTYSRVGQASKTVGSTSWVYTFDGPFSGRTGYGELILNGAFGEYTPQYSYHTPGALP